MLPKFNSPIKLFSTFRVPHWSIWEIEVAKLLRYTSSFSNTGARFRRRAFIFDLYHAALAVFVFRRFQVPESMAWNVGIQAFPAWFVC
jgi:hypothetical protein